MNKKQVRKDNELIDSLGGTSALSRLMDVHRSTVSHWRVRGIPEMTRFYILHTHADKINT